MNIVEQIAQFVLNTKAQVDQIVKERDEALMKVAALEKVIKENEMREKL